LYVSQPYGAAGALKYSLKVDAREPGGQTPAQHTADAQQTVLSVLGGRGAGLRLLRHLHNPYAWDMVWSFYNAFLKSER